MATSSWLFYFPVLASILCFSGMHAFIIRDINLRRENGELGEASDTSMNKPVESLSSIGSLDTSGSVQDTKSDAPDHLSAYATSFRHNMLSNRKRLSGYNSASESSEKLQAIEPMTAQTDEGLDLPTDDNATLEDLAVSIDNLLSSLVSKDESKRVGDEMHSRGMPENAFSAMLKPALNEAFIISPDFSMDQLISTSSSPILNELQAVIQDPTKLDKQDMMQLLEKQLVELNNEMEELKQLKEKVAEL